MDVTVLMMSYKRRDNLERIMDALRNQTCQPKEIIIINNESGVTLDIEGATVINCDRNLGPVIRPAIGLLVRTSHVMCHDDDLYLGPRAIENCMYWGERLPGSILGYEGKRLAAHDKPYSGGRWRQAGPRPEPYEIDIVYAKAAFFEPKIYTYHWDLFYRMDNPLNDEDIITSLANQERGNKNYLVPLVSGARPRVLSDYGVALSKRANFWAERDRVANDALRAMGRGRWAEESRGVL